MPNKPDPNIVHLTEEIFAQVMREIWPLYDYRDTEKASLEEIWKAVSEIGSEEAITVYGQIHETRTTGHGRSLQMAYKALQKMAKTWTFYRAVELVREATRHA